MTLGPTSSLVHDSPSLILVLGGDMVCREVSRGWRERLAEDVAASAVLTAATLFDVEVDAELPERLGAVVSGRDPLVAHPAELRVAEGIVPCQLSAWHCAEEGDGEPLAIVAATELSGDEATIAQLTKLQSRHRLILDAAGEGVYGLDRDGRLTFGNAAAEGILGWSTERILGKIAHDVHHHSHRDGTHYPVETCPIYAALEDGEVHTVENEVFWHANGEAVPIEYTSTPILRDGKPDGAVVVFRDISRRKELERQREEAFEQIEKLKEQLEQERDYLRDEINVTQHFGEIVGESLALKHTLAQVEAVAPTPANVLVLGESGVGKEMIARAIHSRSPRSERPLVKVNCASIPEDLFESEFFGHVKGAFTGAHRDRTGRLQLADGGTVFLDEVGEIPLSLQGKLLRALQEREFERVGDDRTIKVDVRVVAATNRDLAEEVKQGRFREDLYYRLSVFPVEVPPLRERIEDIGPLAIHFLEVICRDLGCEEPRITKRQVATLRAHTWPGNIRELRNVIERAIISSTGSRLRLESALPAPVQSSAPPPLAPEDDEVEYLTEAEFRQLEKSNLVAALKRTNWRVWGPEGAASLLGIKPSTLSYRMKKVGIRKPDDTTSQ